MKEGKTEAGYLLSELGGGAGRYCGLRTGGDMCRVFVESNVFVTSGTLKDLHLGSYVPPSPVSSSQISTPLLYS